MALSLKYQGQETSRNKNQFTYKETLQGTEAEVDAFMQTCPAIGTYVQDKGYLTSTRKYNADGIFFNFELEYTINYESGFANTDTTIYGEKSAQLTIRNLQLPLEKCKKYKTNWNHYLAAISGNSVPGWWDTVSSTVISGDMGANKYMWLNNLSDRPTELVSGKEWVILKDPQKPGVEYYDYSVFVVTETAKYGSASSAGSAVSKNINKIVSPQNTFGLTGEWKMDEANVVYNGQDWIATNVYTRAADKWDEDIYGS